VARFARQIAGQGYICAAPSSYHEFTGPEPLKYDAEDTDKGNAWKIGKVSEITQFHEYMLYLHFLLLSFIKDLLILFFFFFFFRLEFRC
jgi:dienelactone hydrolase